MARVPENKRLRSAYLGGVAVAATGVDQDTVLANFVFQDDVKVVGFNITQTWEITDAHSNADGAFDGVLELSRQATRLQPGSMGMINCGGTWNAAIVIGSDIDKNEFVMMPDDTGWEFDEGESINLLIFVGWVGTGNVNVGGHAIVYYTER